MKNMQLNWILRIFQNGADTRSRIFAIAALCIMYRVANMYAVSSYHRLHSSHSSNLFIIRACRLAAVTCASFFSLDT